MTQPVFNHLINLHLKSGVEFEPSAIIHHEGQLDKLNAIIAQEGAIAQAFITLISSFILLAVSICHPDTFVIVAYTIHPHISVLKKINHETKEFFIIVFILILFIKIIML